MVASPRRRAVTMQQTPPRQEKLAAVSHKPVQVRRLLAAPTYHPIKAARLLYSLPAALLRGPIYLIFLIVFVGLIYSIWAREDIIVTAPLVLQKDSTTIQATGAGVVGQLFARPNTRVQAGDLLATVSEKLTPLDNAHREALDSQLVGFIRNGISSRVNMKVGSRSFNSISMIS
jgi:hypothetical protein